MAIPLFLEYVERRRKTIFKRNDTFKVKKVTRLHDEKGEVGTLLSFDFPNGDSLKIKDVVELVKKDLKAVR